MRGLCLILLILLASCAMGRPAIWEDVSFGRSDAGLMLERAPAGGVAGEQVALAFRPPPTARARVIHSHDRSRPGLSTSLRWAAVVRLSRADSGWALSATDHVQIEADGSVGPTLTGNDRVVERISTLGEWLGADGVERLVDASTPPGKVALTGARRQRLRAHVWARLAADWNAMVYLWSGRRFELGTVWSSERAVPSPGGQAVRMQSTFAWEGRVPCAPGELEAACVRLRLRSTPLPESAASFVLESWLEDHEAGGDPSVTHAVVSEDVVVIAHPATLLPRRFTRSRHIRGVVTVGGEARRIDNSDIWTRTYEWLD